jgi:hypothetical protein
VLVCDHEVLVVIYFVVIFLLAKIGKQAQLMILFLCKHNLTITFTTTARLLHFWRNKQWGFTSCDSQSTHLHQLRCMNATFGYCIYIIRCLYTYNSFWSKISYITNNYPRLQWDASECHGMIWKYDVYLPSLMYVIHKLLFTRAQPNKSQVMPCWK